MDAEVVKGFKLRESNVGSVCGEGGRRDLDQRTFLKSQRTFRLGAEFPSLELQQVLAVDDDVLETPGEVWIVLGVVGPGFEPGEVVLGSP